MFEHRTRAERRVDALSAELRKLRAMNPESRGAAIRINNRIHEITSNKLPAAWRAVNQIREELKR